MPNESNILQDKSNESFTRLTPGCWTSHDDRGGAHAHDDHGLDGLHDGDHAGVPDHGGDHIGRWGHDRAEVNVIKQFFGVTDAEAE